MTFAEDKLVFSIDDLKNAVNSKVRILLLNSPQNPSSKVFTREELLAVREVVKENPQLIVISDEVYFNLNFADTAFVSFAALPDMFSKTITVYSIGKTFSGDVQKNRFGYAVGHPALLKEYQGLIKGQAGRPVREGALVNLRAILSTAAAPYKGSSNFYAWNKQRFMSNFKRIEAALTKLGLKVIPPEGGYFCMIDIKLAVAHRLPLSYFYSDFKPELAAATLSSYEAWKSLEGAERTPDFAFCLYLADKYGLALWPVSGFSNYDQLGTPLADRTCVDLVRISLTRDDAAIAKLELFAANNSQFFG